MNVFCKEVMFQKHGMECKLWASLWQAIPGFYCDSNLSHFWKNICLQVELTPQTYVHPRSLKYGILGGSKLEVLTLKNVTFYYALRHKARDVMWIKLWRFTWQKVKTFSLEGSYLCNVEPMGNVTPSFEIPLLGFVFKPVYNCPE